MNGYSVVKGHAHSPHKRGKQAESFRTSPPVSSLNDDCSTTYSRIFFNLFSAADMDFPMAERYNPPFQRFVRM